MAKKEVLAPIDRELIDLEIERSRLDREKSMLILNKGMFLYFAFLFVGVIGFINGYLSKALLNVLIVMSLIVLIVATLPYIRTMHIEEHRIKDLIDDLKAKKRR
ncbi:hypothetical protein KY339_04925 [Candidatus Woesearchaeota archaeon]|nr:hypothetical protein [Candidatus Woesearchaeota archaeon]